MAKAQSKPPSAADRQAFKAKHGGNPHHTGVSLKRDNKGVYVHTHRARSKSYPSADRIPKRVIDFVESTG
jgi:hypothetical protein